MNICLTCADLQTCKIIARFVAIKGYLIGKILSVVSLSVVQTLSYIYKELIDGIIARLIKSSFCKIISNFRIFCFSLDRKDFTIINTHDFYEVRVIKIFYRFLIKNQRDLKSVSARSSKITKTFCVIIETVVCFC